MQPILRGTEPDFARTRNDDPGPAGQDSRESFPEGEDETIAPPFDFRSLLEAVAARWRWVAEINPMTAMLESFRICLVGVGTLTPESVIISISGTVLLLVTGMLIFQRTERTFIDSV